MASAALPRPRLPSCHVNASLLAALGVDDDTPCRVPWYDPLSSPCRATCPFFSRRCCCEGANSVLLEGVAERRRRARHLLVVGQPFSQGLGTRQADRVRAKNLFFPFFLGLMHGETRVPPGIDRIDPGNDVPQGCPSRAPNPLIPACTVPP